MGSPLDLRLTFLVCTSLVLLRYAQTQTPSPDPRGSCMSYLSEKLSGRYSSAQVEKSCDRYLKWGNMMKSGPKVQMKQTERDYWNHLHGTFRHKPVVRKEYRMLSDLERTGFHSAVNRLKLSMEGDMSRYDVVVGFHQPSLAPGAHFGPAFLGWHREFILRMEQALQQIDSRVALPYWDSTMDEVLGEEARKSIMWSDSFAGNLDGDVVTGPFKRWDIFYPVQNRTKLFRMAVPEGGLFTDDVISETINARTHRDITWFVDPTFEFVHGMVHDWVGGVLGDLGVSPADPVFFLHHSFVDCTFEWHRQDKIQLGADVRYSYPNDTVAHGVGIANPLGDITERTEDSLHSAVRPMEPFQGLLNIDGNSDSYNSFYSCAPRPSCTKSKPTCGSPYLFCETKKEKCAPKLRAGANCTKWKGMNPCYEGVCCKGVCSQTCADAKYQETVYRHEEPSPSLRKPVVSQYNAKTNNHQRPSHYQQPPYQHQPFNQPANPYQIKPQPNTGHHTQKNHPTHQAAAPVPHYPTLPPYQSHPGYPALYPTYPHQPQGQGYSPWQNPQYPAYRY